MNKKILVVGSILAVVILITVSFTSVVGFQSNSITKAKESPLFTVRTKNAINEKQDALTCEYVRKDKGFTIPLPTYDIRNALLQKLINRIRDLDRESLNKLKALRLPKYSPEVLKEYPIDFKEDKKNANTFETAGGIPECCWTKIDDFFCKYYNIIMLLAILTFIPIIIAEWIVGIICLIIPAFKTFW